MTQGHLWAADIYHVQYSRAVDAWELVAQQ